MMLGKLTWTTYGLVFFAGLLSACTQEAREPVEVGAAQVELRSDLVLSEMPTSSTVLLAEENPEHPGQSTNPKQAIQRIPLKGLRNYSQDRAYRAVKRYEFLPALLKDSKTQKSFAQGGNAHANSWTLADKYWVRAGKGFGVAAAEMAPPETVHLDDAPYYFPTVVLKPYSKASEHLEPVTEPFKSRKPLVFHSGATGFAHEPPADTTTSGHLPALETRRVLSPIPETQVYLSSKPNTQVTLAPAKHRLDLMNNNENLNRDRFGKLPQPAKHRSKLSQSVIAPLNLYPRIQK